MHSTLSTTLREYPFLSRIWIFVGTTVLYRFAYRVVTVSQDAKTDLVRVARLVANKVVSIYNPVIRHDFGDIVAKAANHPWAWNPDRPLVLAAGRLTIAKDYPNLIRAFFRVCEVIDARLLILGDGELRNSLQELVHHLKLEDKVDMAGRVENVLPYMKAADVFVLSSSREGFGNVLVEAMAAGTPVVSTDCPSGPREILEEGRWGKLVPVGDPESLADAIVKTIQNGGVVSSSRARDFSVEVAAAKYLSLIGLDGDGG